MTDKINLGDLAFRPEDFLLRNESLNPGLSVAYILCDNANRILREKLSMAPLKQGNVEFDAWTEELDPHMFTPTHTARMVCIEEIKK